MTAEVLSDNGRRIATVVGQPYRVGPFSGGDAGSEFYHRNNDRCHDGQQGCVICGRPIKNIEAALWVGTNWDGTWATDGTSGSMGSFPVGPDCHRKYRVKS